MNDDALKQIKAIGKDLINLAHSEGGSLEYQRAGTGINVYFVMRDERYLEKDGIVIKQMLFRVDREAE